MGQSPLSAIAMSHSTPVPGLAQTGGKAMEGNGGQEDIEQ